MLVFFSGSLGVSSGFGVGVSSVFIVSTVFGLSSTLFSIDLKS